MKTRVFAWIISLGLTLISHGQDAEAQKRFEDAFFKSEGKTIAVYPDAANLESPLSMKMKEIDMALKAADDPLYYSPDKPYLIAKQAADELGIAPVATKSEAMEASAKVGDAFPELNEYKNVTIRSIEPDGIRIMHESGAAKIPIERLTPAQREAFGLSAEIATEHRRNLEARVAAAQARRQESQRQMSPSSKAGAREETPRYVTPDQIKLYWFRKLPTPRTMDRDFHSAKKAREVFVAEIRAGFHDLTAEKTAAQYNKEEALRIGDHERARLCEAELARIGQQEADQQRREEAERALNEARRARIQSQVMSAQLSQLQSDLHFLSHDLNSIRMSLR